MFSVLQNKKQRLKQAQPQKVKNIRVELQPMRSRTNPLLQGVTVSTQFPLFVDR